MAKRKLRQEQSKETAKEEQEKGSHMRGGTVILPTLNLSQAITRRVKQATENPA
jgi:hypothetical protein